MSDMRNIICQWISGLGHTRAIGIKLKDIDILVSQIGGLNHDWQCGCAHWNGSNLSICADCGRKPNER